MDIPPIVLDMLACALFCQTVDWTVHFIVKAINKRRKS